MDGFWALPPVTRTITALAVVVSALGYSRLISLSNYIFWPPTIFTTKAVPQLWRFFTSFLITHAKLGVLMDPYFLYQYGSGLETESSRFPNPGDFFVYTMFVGSVIVGTAGMLVGGVKFLHALSLAYAYTYAQDNPTRQVSFFVITFDSKYLPYAMLILTMILEGGHATMVQACGLVAAHLYDFLTRIWPTFGGGTNYIRTPQIVRGWFAPKAGQAQQRSYGLAYEGRREGNTTGQATGRSTGVSGVWDRSGPGRRLGE